jgi:hypothetical protein
MLKRPVEIQPLPQNMTSTVQYSSFHNPNGLNTQPTEMQPDGGSVVNPRCSFIQDPDFLIPEPVVKKALDPESAKLRTRTGFNVKKELDPGSAALRISPGSRVKKALDPGSATLLISTVPPGPGVKNALDPGSATLLISTGQEGRKALDPGSHCVEVPVRRSKKH